MADAIIFDVDGTLCDVSGIRHYLLDDPLRKNFDKFHAAAAYAPAHTDIVKLAQECHAKGLVVIVVTARVEKWRYLTATWLAKHEVPVDHLLMRRDGDGRKDYIVKREILNKIRRRYRVIFAVDDNPSVIALWESEGIVVEVVPGWIVKDIPLKGETDGAD